MKDTMNRLKKYYDVDEEEIVLSKDEREIMITREDMCKNTILYGPSGTGKTYNVAYKVLEIIDYEKYMVLLLLLQNRDVMN